MPVTFFAHQVPVLPIARRWPAATDGVALVVGSMAPDMAYVLNGSRFSLWAHGGPGLVLFCVPVTVVVSWIVVRVLAPVVPGHLPDLGPFHLRDLRGLAWHRFGWLTVTTSALLGALTHVGLDHFTHDWGWFARHLDWYDELVIDRPVLGRRWTVFRAVQYGGHVGGTALCLWMLACLGRRRWMLGRAERIPAPMVDPVSHGLLWGPAALGFGTALGWVAASRSGTSTDTLRIAGGAFVGLTAGALACGRYSGRWQTASTLLPSGSRTNAP